MTREEWVAAAAAHFMKRIGGLGTDFTEETALELAEIEAQEQNRAGDGCDVIVDSWDSPEDAVNEELSNWIDDGD